MHETSHRSPHARLALAACLALVVGGCAATAPATEAPAAVTPPAAQASTVAADPAGSPSAAGLPPIGDIPFYKADGARSGVHPGPGPLVEPVEAWRVQLGCAATELTGVVGAGLLVTGCDAPVVTAIDLATGTTRWTHDLDSPVDGLAIDGGSVFATDDAGGVTPNGLASGDVAWHVSGPGGGTLPAWSPIVDGGVLYLPTHDGRFIGLDTTDGSEVWSWSAPSGVRGIGGTVLDGTAYVSGDDGSLRAIAIASGDELWSFRTLSGRVSSTSITKDAVFVAALLGDDSGRGELYALDPRTGAEQWRYQSPSGSQVAPPVTADGVVYAPTEGGLVALDAVTGGVRWRSSTAPATGMAPAIAGEAVYQNTDRGVAAISRSDGEVLWSIDLGASHDNSALVTGGMVIESDTAGLVHAFVEPALAGYFALPSAAPSPPSFSPASPLPERLTLAATFDADSSDLAIPHGVATGPDGRLYVVNTATSEILVLDADTGSIVRRWGEQGSGRGEFSFVRDPSDPFSAAGGVAVGDDGTVYVADTANRRVQQFDADGRFVREWGRFGSDNGQFLDPMDIDVGPDGDVYVLDASRSDIQRFTSDGRFVSVLGGYGTGPGELASMGGIGVGPDGTIYSADFDTNRVQAWNPDGTFAWSIAGNGSDGELYWPSDVAVDEAGLIYVSEGPGDPPLRRISTYNQRRELLGTWIAPGPTNTLAYRDGNCTSAASSPPRFSRRRSPVTEQP